MSEFLASFIIDSDAFVFFYPRNSFTSFTEVKSRWASKWNSSFTTETLNKIDFAMQRGSFA